MVKKQDMIYIYLEDWQKRQVKEVTGKDQIKLGISVEGGLIPIYAVYSPGPECRFMWLTNGQKAQILDEAGADCSVIDIKHPSVHKEP